MQNMWDQKTWFLLRMVHSKTVCLKKIFEQDSMGYQREPPDMAYSYYKRNLTRGL